MGWLSGAAAGAADSLEEILTKKLLEKQQADALALQQQRLAQDAQQNQDYVGLRSRELARLEAGDAADEAFRGRQEAQAASARSNQQGTRTMIGDFLTRRTPGQALSDQDRGTLETMAVTDDIPLPASLTAKPQRRVVTTIGPRGGPISKLVSEEELEQGVPEYRAPTSSGGSATPQQDWVIRDGKPVPIPKGTARPGDQPYDPVAARSSQPTNKDEAIDTAREVQRIARSLRTHEGLSGTFGVVSSRLPTMRQGTADAETLLNSLQGLLTIENMGKMKGVLSDADMRILRQASTTLDAKMSEPAARAELLRLEQVMSKLTGDMPSDDEVPVTNTGSGGDRASGAGSAGGGGFRILSVE